MYPKKRRFWYPPKKPGKKTHLKRNCIVLFNNMFLKFKNPLAGHYDIFRYYTFSALALLVGQQEEHPARNKL